MVWMGYKTLSFPWIFPISVKFFFIIPPASLFVCRWWSMLGLDQVKYTSLWCMSINIIVVDGIFSLKKSKSCLFFKTGSWSHLSLVHFLSFFIHRNPFILCCAGRSQKSLCHRSQLNGLTCRGVYSVWLSDVLLF